MGQRFKVLALGGDGVGPEVVACGLQLLDAVASREDFSVDISEDLLHGAAWETYGTFCREETLTAAKAADGVLVGAVGGPKWDGIRVPGGPEMQDGLMRLRNELDTYAGLRPARAWTALEHLTPFREGLAAEADVMVLREMAGGAFFAQPRGIEMREGRRYGFDTAAYNEDEIARIAHAGFQLARARRGKLCSADKANVMESYVLWRDVVGEVAADYPDVELSLMYADNCAYQLIRRPADFDVIVADNLLGDILSDQAGAIAGSLGMLPSACLSGLAKDGERRLGLYEPVHGTAPDIAGQGIANPIGMLLSVAMMFEYAFGRPELARRVDATGASVLEAGIRTPDIGGTSSTSDVTGAVIAALQP
ncbi:MAG: 3-isopropylmalate dehydrogenase [Hyphomicrobiaceae bacterium]